MYIEHCSIEYGFDLQWQKIFLSLTKNRSYWKKKKGENWWAKKEQEQNRFMTAFWSEYFKMQMKKQANQYQIHEKKRSKNSFLENTNTGWVNKIQKSIK